MQINQFLIRNITLHNWHFYRINRFVPSSKFLFKILKIEIQLYVSWFIRSIKKLIIDTRDLLIGNKILRLNRVYTLKVNSTLDTG